MKHIGRGIAIIGVCLGVGLMVIFTKDSCTTAAALCIAIFCIWADVD